MTTFLKIMTGTDDKIDSAPSANFGMHILPDGAKVYFAYGGVDSPRGTKYDVHITLPDGNKEVIGLTGNAYLMSETGKTIASHGYE